MSGGGMKCSFGVGAILAIAEKYKIKEPFLLICGSGSAGTGSYYVSAQYKSIRNIWTNLVSSKTIYLIPALNKKTGKIDYLDVKKNDIFECMRATKAMPIAFKLNPKVEINNSFYCDSPISSKPETHIKKL